VVQHGALVLSSVALQYAHVAARRGWIEGVRDGLIFGAMAVNFGYRHDRVKSAALMLVTAAFGATFVGMQGFEWTKLIMEGVRPWGNPWVGGSRRSMGRGVEVAGGQIEPRALSRSLRRSTKLTSCRPLAAPKVQRPPTQQRLRTIVRSGWPPNMREFSS
jgi:hypothetical protein